MAANPQNAQEIACLLQASAAARARLGREVGVLRQCLSGPAKAAQAVREHPLRWLGGLLGTGFVATLLLRRKPAAVARKSQSLRGFLFGVIATAVQPVVKTWLTGHAKQLLASHLQAKSPPSAFSLNSRFPTRP